MPPGISETSFIVKIQIRNEIELVVEEVMQIFGQIYQNNETFSTAHKEHQSELYLRKCT